MHGSSDYFIDSPYIDLKSICPYSLHTGLSVVLGIHIKKIFDVPSASPFLPLDGPFPVDMFVCLCYQVWLSDLSTALWVCSRLHRTKQGHHLLHFRDQCRHSTLRILRNTSYYWFTLNKLLTTTPILLWATDCEIKNSVFIPRKLHLVIFGPGTKERYQHGHIWTYLTYLSFIHSHSFIHSFNKLFLPVLCT